MQTSYPIFFAEGASATAIEPTAIADVETALPRLGLQGPRPVIVLVGGAAGLRHYHIARLHSLFSKVLAPLADALGAVVIDGGTDTGVMRMMGATRQSKKFTFPLVGVLPVGVGAIPNQLPHCTDATLLEPNHTHFMLVPGRNWGDDSPWIAEIARLISQGMPSMTVLINGGEITWRDAAESVRLGRPIVAIANSGRTADALVTALAGTPTDERAIAIIASGLLQAVELENHTQLREVMQEILLEKVVIGC